MVTKSHVTGRVPGLLGRESKGLMFSSVFLDFTRSVLKLWNWRRKAGRNRREYVQRWQGKGKPRARERLLIGSPPKTDSMDPTLPFLSLPSLQLRWDVLFFLLSLDFAPTNTRPPRGFCYE